MKQAISDSFNQAFKSIGSSDPFISTLNMSLTADQNFVFTNDFHVTLFFFGSDHSQIMKCPLIKDGIFKEDA